MTCDTCQGTGEIIVDWCRYLDPRPDDKGDEAVAACADCDGTGGIDAPGGDDGS